MALYKQVQSNLILLKEIPNFKTVITPLFQILSWSIICCFNSILDFLGLDDNIQHFWEVWICYSYKFFNARSFWKALFVYCINNTLCSQFMSLITCLKNFEQWLNSFTNNALACEVHCFDQYDIFSVKNSHYFWNESPLILKTNWTHLHLLLVCINFCDYVLHDFFPHTFFVRR